MTGIPGGREIKYMAMKIFKGIKEIYFLDQRRESETVAIMTKIKEMANKDAKT